MLKIQPRAFALVLSLSAHLGLCMMAEMSRATSGSSEPDHVEGSLRLPGIAVRVGLIGSDSWDSALLLPDSGGLHVKAQAEQFARPAAMSIQDSAIPPALAHAGIHTSSDTAPAAARYFQLPDLTQEPLVAKGLENGKLLRVQHMSPQSFTVRVWINDLGDVEKVMLEGAGLSSEEEQLVVENFLKVKFHPAKIGRIAVSSQFEMEILLDDLLQA